MQRTDADKWKDKRFRELSKDGKLIYVFLWENSNKAGFYKIADPDHDCYEIGCTTDEYANAIKELSKPKPKPGTDEIQRGFISIKPWVFITHKIKHTQDHFGTKAIPGHISVLKELVAMYDVFKDYPEYMDVLEKVDKNLFKAWKIADPIAIEALSDNRINKTPVAPKTRPVSNPIDDVYDIFQRRTKINQVRSEARDHKIRTFFRETSFSVQDIEKVVINRVAVWKDDPGMRNHLNIETILKPEHFTKYLENANHKPEDQYAPSINQKRNIHQ